MLKCPDCGFEATDYERVCPICNAPLKGITIESDLPIKEEKIKDDRPVKSNPDWYAKIHAKMQAKREAQQEPPIPHCPKCGSTSITVMKKGFGVGKSLIGGAVAGPVGLLAGGIGANKVQRVCINCGHKF